MVTRLASKSQELYRRARNVTPGGVNSPVRSYPPYPLFVESATGSRFQTADHETYLDFCMGYGALLEGHGPRAVVEAVRETVERGTIFGQPTELEVELAELITDIVPSVETVRLVNSGTEATMHAIRLARGFTGKRKILKFEGGFHGSHDAVLVNAGSGLAHVGTSSSEGVPPETARNTLVIPYNDEKMASKILTDYGDELAAVIIEPVMGNIGPITPMPGFLETLRKITEEEEVLLIFDETITGFRLSLGGAQEYYKVHPDLTTLGKVMGGGLPIAAFGGRGEIMEKLAPDGPVYQAGTFSGNPVSVAASLATLRSLKNSSQGYRKLAKIGEELRRSISDAVTSRRVEAQVNGIASLLQVFFTGRPVTDYQSAKSSDLAKFQKYFQSLLSSHIFIPPSQFETCFLSTAHTDDDLRNALEAVDDALRKVAG
jgi:glutamate-1-semialdehyde 2,1-aminomutase